MEIKINLLKHIKRLPICYDSSLAQQYLKKNNWVILGYGHSVGSSFTWAVKLYEDCRDFHKIWGQGFIIRITNSYQYGDFQTRNAPNLSDAQDWFIIPDDKATMILNRIYQNNKKNILNDENLQHI